MTLFRVFAVTLTCLTAAPAIGGNESRAKAYPLADGLFEVVADFSENAIYWCGAGTYAQSKLSRPVSDIIYVWQGPSPSTARPGERSVRFGLEPPAGFQRGSSYSTDVAIVGNFLTVAQARQTCNERTSSG